MTDKERIKDLERRVAQLEDIFERLGVSGDEHLICYTHNDRYGRACRMTLGEYLQYNCKFGKSKENDDGSSN